MSREGKPSKDYKFRTATIDIIERNDSLLLYAYALADDGKGYSIGRAGKYATRIVVSGRYARAIWHLIGAYTTVHDAGDGIYYVQADEAEGQQ